MSRREIAGMQFGILASGGIGAAVGASALAENSPWVPYLAYGGLVTIAIGLLGLLAMFIWLGKKPTPLEKPEATPAIKIAVAERSSFHKMRTHGDGPALQIDRAVDVAVDDWKHTQSKRDD